MTAPPADDGTLMASLWAIRLPNGRFFGFFSHATSIWTGGERATLVDLYADPDGDYYGAYITSEGKVYMVQPSKMQWEMQSPDFFRRDIAEGRVLMLRLRAVPRETP